MPYEPDDVLRSRYYDRADAGRRLAAELASDSLPDPIVLALPRGGVPVGFEIASQLHAPLDVVVVRKIGVPWQPELAMGAIAGRSFQVLDRDLIGYLNVSPSALAQVMTKERAEAQRQETLFRHGRPALDLRGRTVVLVDDGLATGATMLVAVRYVRSFEPARIIVAVPVGSREACARVAKEVDSVVCVMQPEPFQAVGLWYSDFRQVEDAEVQSQLEENRKQMEARSSQPVC